MREINRKGEERLSPRQAAERLTDIAYALTTGGTLNLGGGQKVTVPVADEVVLKREGESNDGHIKLELSWSTTTESPPASPGAVPEERRARERLSRPLIPRKGSLRPPDPNH